jgi:carboxyl-terminal processing protease
VSLLRVLIVPFILFAGLGRSQDSLAQASIKSDLYQLKKLVAERHLQPRAFDESLSRDVALNLLRMIDPDKLYYTEPEFYKIIAYQSRIGNDLKNDTWTFLPAFQEITSAVLTRAKKNLLLISQQGLDLDKKELFKVDTTWAADEVALQKRMRATIKFDILTQLALDRGNENAALTEKRYTRAVHANKLRSIDKLLQYHAGFEALMGSLFLKAFLQAHDAHSVYLPPVEMQNFVASLSSQGFQFGFMLEEDLSGNVIIKGLVPGSPAWKCGEIHSGDIIEGLAWHGKEKTDATLLDIEEVEAILMESNHDVLDLELRASNGSVKQVMLKKELRSTDDDIVRSSVLVADARVGYISLPGFYSDWDHAGGSQCANDVAKAILKLKKENIKGLILDLRFNGGGSLEEAVAMAGIFIDAGPMGLLRARAGEPVTYKDFNRGTVWDGPLVIMVNGLSASASEFVAAALQDYNRAVVVGSKTYGKGTAQVLFSLEPGKPVANMAAAVANKKTGYATITMERCYRISGKSVQYTGVIPDVTIPEAFDYSEYQEATLPFALKPDEIFKKVYYRPLPAITLNTLNNNARQRIAQSPYFTQVTRMKEIMHQSLEEKKEFMLSRVDFKIHFEGLSASVKSLTKMLEQETGAFNVEFVSSDLELMRMDEYFNEMNKSWSKTLKSDYVLGETVNIINDFIRISKTP